MLLFPPNKSLEKVLMFLGEYWCWSLQRLKGVIVGTFVFLRFHLVLVLETMIEARSCENVCAQYVQCAICDKPMLWAKLRKLHENSNFDFLPIAWKWCFIICTRTTLAWTYTFIPFTLPSPITLVWSTYTFIPLTLPFPITLVWTNTYIPFTLPSPPLLWR